MLFRSAPGPQGGIRFQPAQTNIDNDSISDRVVTSGEVFRLDVFLDPISLLNQVDIVEYRVSFDRSEIKFADFIEDQPSLASGCSSDVDTCSMLHQLSAPIANGDSPLRLGSFLFETVDPEKWPGDGSWDLLFDQISYSKIGRAHV